MTRGGAGNMLGVGGTRRRLGRAALRGGGRVGGGLDPRARKRELLRALRAQRQEREGDDGKGTSPGRA
ncbi:DUF6243 family protein [Streptomyces heliomycini]|uniref:DUF6243 family protein n=1 Tax=Streptomyces heliomycini TaxID=284032 RepID=A0ABV5LGX1_9ACTN